MGNDMHNQEQLADAHYRELHAPPTRYFDVVFDGPPEHVSGRFVEVENERGASIRMGEWVHRPDGYWALRIPLREPVSPAYTFPPEVEAAAEALRVLLAAFLTLHLAYGTGSAEQWPEVGMAREALAALSSARSAAPATKEESNG